MLLTDQLLLNYKRCRRRTYLEVYGNRAEKDPEKEFLLKLKKENQLHITSTLESLLLPYQKPDGQDSFLNSQQTQELMAQGAECIYGGSLYLSFEQWQDSIITKNDHNSFDAENIAFLGKPTLLIKIPGESIFGDWLYFPINIKLGRRPKPEYKLIAAYHAQMLAAIQGVLPPQSELILRQQNSYQIHLEYWLERMYSMVAECVAMLMVQQEPEVFISRQRCSLCSWYSHCYNIAKSQQHLSLIPGVTPKRYESLIDMGLDSVESIAAVSSERLGDKIGKSIALFLKQQTQSLLLEKAMVRADLKLQDLPPSSPIELYFDIEAEPDRQVDYLLGVLFVDRIRNTKKFYPFLAEHPTEEAQAWKQFFEFVSLYPEAKIFHFSEYEVETIKRLANLYQTPQSSIKVLLSRFVDLHHLVTKTVILPVESYSLKSVANWLGFSWREEDGSGDQSVCWYDSWLKTQDRTFLDAILSYNEDDCYATYHLKNWLVDFLEQSQQK
ncbi:MAG: TM0106 family RecB-like putative nuclease [Xenococcaceae cyanobacterium MO_167.B52]|nr:TM0106 family RecB-like putative nuclease [Xenococcaceae cyanobacterium MO_167.B52]